MITLEGKNILVTGASSGIGKEVAITASKIGAVVTILGRDQERLENTLKLMTGDNHRIGIVDLNDSEQVNDFMATCTPFDGVVFNAGIVEYSPVKFLNQLKINTIFSINFESHVLLCQKLQKRKLLNKKGSLVFLSSISCKLGIPGTAMYAASKAAISAFSKVVASEVAAQGIRSNSICPGIVQTEMIDKAQVIIKSDDSETLKKREYPLGYGEPADIANLVVFMLSDLSKWITGTEIIIDGGLTLK